MGYKSTYMGDTVDNRIGAVKIGGTAGQALLKQSNADFDTAWQDVPSTQYLTFTPVDGATVPNNTLYVEVSNNALRFKDSAGVIYNVDLTAV